MSKTYIVITNLVIAFLSGVGAYNLVELVDMSWLLGFMLYLLVLVPWAVYHPVTFDK